MKVVLAAYHTPGIRAIEFLVQEQYKPEDILLITHDLDNNKPLVEFAKNNRVDTITSDIRSKDVLFKIRKFQPDLIFSLYFRDKVPEQILRIAHLGAINLHPSLLPCYRGAFSAPWAIINGEKMTGISYHFMEKKFDTGKILFQKGVVIRDTDTAYSLYNRLLVEGMNSFPDAYNLVIDGFKGKRQKGKQSYYPREVPFEGKIDSNWSREEIDRFIRALYFPPFKAAVYIDKHGNEHECYTIDDYDKVQDKE